MHQRGDFRGDLIKGGGFTLSLSLVVSASSVVVVVVGY